MVLDAKIVQVAVVQAKSVVPIVMEVAQMLLVTIATHVQAQATKNALGVGVEDIKIAPFVMAEATRIARTVTEQVALSAKIATDMGK